MRAFYAKRNKQHYFLTRTDDTCNAGWNSPSLLDERKIVRVGFVYVDSSIQLETWCIDLFCYQKENHLLIRAASRKPFLEKYSISGTDILELAHTVTRYILVFSGGLGIFTKINGICRVSENGLWHSWWSPRRMTGFLQLYLYILISMVAFDKMH